MVCALARMAIPWGTTLRAICLRNDVVRGRRVIYQHMATGAPVHLIWTENYSLERLVGSERRLFFSVAIDWRQWAHLMNERPEILAQKSSGCRKSLYVLTFH